MFNVKKIIKYLIVKIKFKNRIHTYTNTNISLKSKFEGLNSIGCNSYFKGYMGMGSYLGDDSFCNAKIGKYTSIAGKFITLQGRHPYKAPFVTTCPLFFSTKNKFSFVKKSLFEEIIYADNKTKYYNIIGNDCWIGYNVTLIAGIEIGDGAVIFANAVVTKNVQPYSIIAGVPAKIIGYRYDKDTIDYLCKLKWWEKDISFLKDNVDYFCDISKFKANFNIKNEC